MKIKTLIVDDEAKALEILKNKITRFCPQLDIIGTIQAPENVADFIQENAPELVFLDIAMPQMSGFDVLHQLPHLDFELIFVTAFDQYAVEAIEHCAIGYLLKPVSNEKLVKAVSVALENIENKSNIQKNKILIENLSTQNFSHKKIVIPVHGGFELVEAQEIKHIEGDEGYTRIHLHERDDLYSSYRIGHFAQLLENQAFYLTHRSHLVNMHFISKYLNEGYVVLDNGEQIPVSRSRRNQLIEILRSGN